MHDDREEMHGDREEGIVALSSGTSVCVPLSRRAAPEFELAGKESSSLAYGAKYHEEIADETTSWTAGQNGPFREPTEPGNRKD